MSTTSGDTLIDLDEFGPKGQEEGEEELSSHDSFVSIIVGGGSLVGE